MLVTFPDGSVVLAQGRLGLITSDRSRTPDWAVYLDERWIGDPEVTWPYRIIDWPDMGLPINETEFFDAVADIHERAKKTELVEIACYGGIGRTGTVLSCLAITAGVPLESAVDWVREHYDPRAVETDEQNELIQRFAHSL
jgi:protein-tyrosine phosphatase